MKAQAAGLLGDAGRDSPVIEQMAAKLYNVGTPVARLDNPLGILLAHGDAQQVMGKAAEPCP